MNRWFWVVAVLMVALVAISLSARRRETAGEQLLAALNAHHVSTREALLLIDYSPDPELVAQARGETLRHGAGAAPGYGFEAVVPPGQKWVQDGNAVLAWHADAEGRGELRDAVAAAADTIENVLPHSPLDDTFSEEALARARQDLAHMVDERLFLAWISADRGILAETNDREEAFRNAMLLLARPNPGPVLMFQTVRAHVYLLPEERARGHAWCEEEAFDSEGKSLWSGVLRVTAGGEGPSTQQVRTMAVVLGEAALEPEAETRPQPHGIIPF